MHKAYYGNLPYNLAEYFVIDNRVMHFTRNKYKFNVRKNIKSMCLSIKGVNLWNALDNNITGCSDICLFKKGLNKCYFDKYRSNTVTS